MKQAFKIVLGLALIAAGVLWILNISGVVNFEFSTKGWWAIFSYGLSYTLQDSKNL